MRSTSNDPPSPPRSPTPHSSDSSVNEPAQTPASPLFSPNVNDPLLRQASYVSSPLNPKSNSISRPESRGSMSRLLHASSDESAVGPGGYPFLGHAARDTSTRGSMLLYRLASDADPWDDALDMPLPPPSRFSSARFSMASDSGASIMSANSDSKYPVNTEKLSGKGVFLPYAYDPSEDQDSPPDADDLLHDPNNTDADYNKRNGSGWNFNIRGIANMVVLTLLIVALIALFTAYPIVTFVRDAPRNLAIDNNIQVNASGQVPVIPNLAQLIDKDTPEPMKTRTGWDGFDYELVFSDEFNEEGRTFYPGDDPYWEAMDIWYGATQDLEWYSPEQVTTAGGSLRLRLEQSDPSINHNLSYKSGMIQSWNKFCFTRGYIEVNVSFPGTNSDVSGYWPGAWTMGNLGRPGYGASTDGLWPYSYDACDTGTFPNQTNPDKQTPVAATHSIYSRSKYNFELSWLPGQRVSACSCPGSEHPGPSLNVGRGAPEIDILEAQKNKLGEGGKVSQSAQFAPFNHDYISLNDSSVVQWYDLSVTKQNTYQGSALQQAVSALTTVPDRAYFGTGAEYTVMGFEYWGDPNDASQGFITWYVDGKPSYTMKAGAVGPDSTVDIDQRLISREPMSIILNLGVSESFQTVDFDLLTFPSDFLIDYVRVYQRKGETNIGCNPPDFPTSQYIEDHLMAYTNANLSFWAGDPSSGNSAGYSWPKNSKYDGC